MIGRISSSSSAPSSSSPSSYVCVCVCVGGWVYVYLCVCVSVRDAPVTLSKLKLRGSTFLLPTDKSETMSSKSKGPCWQAGYYCECVCVCMWACASVCG